MGRSLIVPVVEVRNIREHPQAALLSIVDVLGYQMVTGLVEDPNGQIERKFLKGVRDKNGKRVPAEVTSLVPDPAAPVETVRYSFRYKEGEKAVYFPADTILPDQWVDKFEVRPYVGTGNRIKRARLRGEPSFGLIVEPADPAWEVGKNVADYYGASLYQPPPRVGKDAEGFEPYDSEIDPLFEKYTDIEDGKLLYGRFLPGEEVVVSEKIHGKNVRVGIVNGVRHAGSRTARRTKPVIHDGAVLGGPGDPGREAAESADLAKDLFWSPWANPHVEELLDTLSRSHKVVILMGETFGRGVQSLDYGLTATRGFRAFDIYVDGRYLDYEEFARTCDGYGVERVPVLHRGPFDLATIKKLAEGKTTLYGNHIREGVVVRSAKERRDPALGRVVLKFISEEYELSKHKDKESVDA